MSTSGGGAFNCAETASQSLNTPHSGQNLPSFSFQPNLVQNQCRGKRGRDDALHAHIPLVHQGRDLNASPIEPRQMSFDRKRSFESIDSVFSFHSTSPSTTINEIHEEEEMESMNDMNDVNEGYLEGNVPGNAPYQQIKLDEFSSVRLPLNIYIEQAFYGNSAQDIFGIDLTPQVRHLQQHYCGRAFYLDRTLFQDFVGVQRPVHRYLFVSYTDGSDGVETTRGNKCGKEL